MKRTRYTVRYHNRPGRPQIHTAKSGRRYIMARAAAAGRRDFTKGASISRDMNGGGCVCNMIDEQRTLELFGYTSDKWSPKSAKSVVAVCEGCGRYRIVNKKSYRRLCISCVRLGDKHHSYGKKFSKSHCQKLSAAQLGEKNHNYGKSASIKTRQKMSTSRVGEKNGFYGKTQSEESRRKVSATKQGVTFEDWDGYSLHNPYCEKFDESCRTRNREKYDNKCFICGKSQSDNITKTGKHRRLSVHHVDMNKDQGCDDHDWNLIPLCINHHGSSHTSLWIARIEYLLKHVWRTTKDLYTMRYNSVQVTNRQV